MTDPYRLLGETLISAARRRGNHRDARPGRAWLSRHLKVASIATVLVLAGGGAAVAASGLLDGSPVPAPQGAPTPHAGSGVPSAGGVQLLALRATDPEGGLPWGMRLVHTTRGETCVQIGRVQEHQLGLLGIDGAFHDDGRFHPLAPDTLPNYTSGYADLNCVLPGEMMLGYAPAQDRNAEWGVIPRALPARQLRSLSWGLLGPHAVSVTYRTGQGMRTIPVSPGTGAYMIVQPITGTSRVTAIGGFQTGSIIGHHVGILLPEPGSQRPVDRIVYRFGSFTCTVGLSSPGTPACPAPAPLRQNARTPTRSLNETVRVAAVRQPHAQCDAEFLLTPCYRALVTFTAPYAVSNAGSEYVVEAKSSCSHATPSSWPIDRDVHRGETVRSLSLGYFNCLTDMFQVKYVNSAPPASAARAPHESVIVGAGKLKRPRLPGASP
jgi:hypothetical protein